MEGRTVRMKLRRVSDGKWGRRLIGTARATGSSRRRPSRRCLASRDWMSTAARYSVTEAS